jgi:hypothetical protein
MAEAESALLSDAVTAWVPALTAGAMNVQESKLPSTSATQDVAMLLPSKVKVMGLFGAKPRPLSPTLPPTVPLVELRLMAGSTVYVASAELMYVVSNAVTVWDPAVASGTVNTQRKLPFASLVQDVASLSSSKPKAMGLFGAKPPPCTTALLPTAPAV